jgi:hypothetical protein
MNKLVQYITFLTLISLLTSCEGIVGGSGYVYDTTTKNPLKGVRVVLLLNDNPCDTNYSDKRGFFKGGRFVGCVPRCPCAKIILTKDSFKSLTVDFDEYWKNNSYNWRLRDSMRVFLERDN